MLIETIGYRPGEFVTLKIREKRDQDFEVTLGGSVDADGMVRIPWEGWCGKRPNAATVVEPQAVPAPETAPVPPSAAANRKRAK
ncbi:MAG TPA: hypothetical protein VE084_00945 [Burkholderiaceae bacterium]|nr:hypothetical protein [Burkholderiaceae bacterium]